MSLHGKAVLVTGGAKRLGRAIVEELAGAGAAVVVHHRSSSKEAKALVSRIKSKGGASVSADLADPDAADGLLADAEGALGRPIDFVVNNASAFPERSLAKAEYADLDAMMRLHVWAPLATARALHATGRSGAVVNLLDARIADQDPAHFPYMVSKKALADLTRTLAVELAPRIRVNGVAPGAVLPPPGKGESHLKAARKAAPLGQAIEPKEIAAAVVYLLSAPNVTGQVLFVDGGRHL